MKGFVFISHSLFLVRFVACGAFKELEAQHDITYIVLNSPEASYKDDVEKILSSKTHKVAWVPYYAVRYKKWNYLFETSCVLHRDKNPSFAVRYEGFSKRYPARYAEMEKVAQPDIYDGYRRSVEEDMGVDPAILALTLRERPDFLVLPSGVFDYLTDDVLLLSEKLSIPTILLVAGWDNISSKGLLYRQPTYLGVWGEQSRQHAIDVQNSDPQKTFVIGTPHYEKYRPFRPDVDRTQLRDALGVPREGMVALFGGAVRQFDETQLLLEIEAAIENGTLPPMHVLYRPHPYRWGRENEINFFDVQWKHISMDPELAENYRAHKESRVVSTIYSAEYLADLYQAVDCMISPMSTVLLEALLCGLPTMAVAFGDGKHDWSADKGAKMVHFKEMYDIPNILICHERGHFFTDFKRLAEQVGDKELRLGLSQSARFFAYQEDQTTYAQRLLNLVNQMAASSPRPSYDTTAVKPGKTYAWDQFWRNTLPKTAKKFLRKGRDVARQGLSTLGVRI